METVRVPRTAAAEEFDQDVPHRHPRPMPRDPPLERDPVLDILMIIATIALFALVGLLIPGLERLTPRVDAPSRRADRTESSGQ